MKRIFITPWWRQILRIRKKLTNYEFAVRVAIDGFGNASYMPVMRQPGVFNSWTRIVKADGQYFAIDLDIKTYLTYTECEEHIKGMKEQIDFETKQKELTITYKPV